MEALHIYDTKLL